jgi:SAM-dependent methyltransferase
LNSSNEPPGTEAFYRDVEARRYALEPHIPHVAGFSQWAERDVLEAGCGMGTDGAQFAKHGANYTGLDQSELALAHARRNFEVRRLTGRFVRGSVTQLPFEDQSFDLVYSFGVIHHCDDTAAAVSEFRRVLRTGGTALVMLYHRGSLNYGLNILVVRRLLAAGLLIPHFADVAARVTHSPRHVFEGHRRLLRDYGLRYLTDTQLFLNNNTDGPGNPLSKVYSRREAYQLFAGFSSITTSAHYLNVRLYPGGERLSNAALGRRLERALGWHLCVRAIR